VVFRGSRNLGFVLLAFDTASPAVTVALHDGSDVIAEKTVIDAMRHGELLTPTIVEVLEAAGAARIDVTAIAVGVGPGPYTGLRVGIVTALVWGSALEVPVYGVCSLDVMARQAIREGAVSGRFLVASDARRKEVYWASYDEDGRRESGPFVDKPIDVPAGRTVVGHGAELYPEHLGPAAAPAYPSAAELARSVAGERVELLDPEPLYLRRPDAQAPGAPKKVS
jgi:tRNA threonylcarbamoyl adenosine modification protein YeaZ